LIHRLSLLVALALAAPAAAQNAAPTDTARIERFVRNNAQLCAQSASTACFDRSFRFADTDKDGQLSLSELQTLQADLFEWVRVNRERLSPGDRRGVFGALAIVELAGLPRLFASYDADGDGKLSRTEMLADVRLDDRPLALLVKDPDAVDWPSLRKRLGAAAPLLDGAIKIR
jgi:hypothetical protein